MIYLLEDDGSIRELICYSLTKTGNEARGFSCPSAFYEAMESEIPELVLLDIMLPEEDGISVLKKLRQNPVTSSIPVIMLTAKGTEFDKVTALDLGADDYVTKPFGVMELLARVKAVLRRSVKVTAPEDERKSFEVGDVFVSVTNHEVMSGGERVNLTYKEFELLCFLFDHRGAVLNRDQILREVWGYEFDGENRTVDVHIRTLRQKLGKSGDIIETVRGIGYKISSKKG